MADWLMQGLWLGVTLLCYALALGLYRKLGSTSLAHPLTISVISLIVLLEFSGTAVEDYLQASWLIDWLLGPATVALAVPLYNQLHLVKVSGRKFILPILIGGAVAPALALLLVWWSDMGEALRLTLLTKSITSPLAMETTALVGGIPSLAAVIVIVTGIIGALVCPWIFKVLNIHSKVARGLALGTVAHAVGTARGFQYGESVGAMATLALCINGIVTSVVLSLWFVVFT